MKVKELKEQFVGKYNTIEVYTPTDEINCKKELYNLIALFIFNKLQKLLQKPLTTIITYCII